MAEKQGHAPEAAVLPVLAVSCGSTLATEPRTKRTLYGASNCANAGATCTRDDMRSYTIRHPAISWCCASR